MGDFKSRKEIYKHLGDGGWVKHKHSEPVNWENVGTWRFDNPESWSIYHPPKAKRKLSKWRLEDEYNICVISTYMDEEGLTKGGERLLQDWDSYKKERIGEIIEIEE